MSATTDFAKTARGSMTQRNSQETLVPWGGSLSRRSLLRGGLGLSCAALGIASAAAMPAEAKLPQEQVSYQPSPKGERKCSGCFNYEGDGNCRVVASPISPDGWCRLWNAR
jgi:hypothetical protein